jgi:selenophosphate synthase
MDSKSPSAKPKPRPTDLVAATGCAAKPAWLELRVQLGQLVTCADGRLLVGAETMNGAAVIPSLGVETAICFTTDFIPPSVDFGAVRSGSFDHGGRVSFAGPQA